MDRLPYYLPSDLKELQRQNLFTAVALVALGAPTSAPIDPFNPPRRILDACCGDAYWISLCHEYMQSLGYPHVEFTGFDIGHFAPDLRQHGINWKFVQHDARNLPLPFTDGYFDLIVISNGTMVFPKTMSHWLRY